MMTDPINPRKREFALGIIAGEGSFCLTAGKMPRRKYGIYVGLRCAVQMGQFSRGTVNALYDHFELGTVDEHKKGYKWIVSSREDCHALRRAIDDYLKAYDSLFPKTAKYQASVPHKAG